MIIVVKKNANEDRLNSLLEWIRSQGLRTHISEGDFQLVVGVIGDTTKLDDELLMGLDIVETVKHVTGPFKNANRKFHPHDTAIEIGDTKIGAGSFAMIAGPCSVESEAQILEVARRVKAAGATMLRGGAFKPRTSPYDFQGLKADGIELLLEAKRETGLHIVTEIMNATHLPLNTLDLSAVPVLHEMTHLPVVVDPSHGTGLARIVPTMAMAAAAVGADGLIIEVHNDPQHALCDGAQSLTPDQFDTLMSKVNTIRGCI